MVHEAMVLEYSGRHLAVIELAAQLKLLLYASLIACLFIPWGLAKPEASVGDLAIGGVDVPCQVAALGLLLGIFETAIAKMRVFRVAEFLGIALMLGLLGTLLLFVVAESLAMDPAPDIRRRASSGRRSRSHQLRCFSTRIACSAS